MTTPEPQREAARSCTTGHDASTPASRIVNGLTVRRRENVSLWRYGILLLRDIILLFVIIGLGMHRLLRYLDANTRRAAE